MKEHKNTLELSKFLQSTLWDSNIFDNYKPSVRCVADSMIEIQIYSKTEIDYKNVLKLIGINDLSHNSKHKIRFGNLETSNRNRKNNKRIPEQERMHEPDLILDMQFTLRHTRVRVVNWKY